MHNVSIFCAKKVIITFSHYTFAKEVNFADNMDELMNLKININNIIPNKLKCVKLECILRYKIILYSKTPLLTEDKYEVIKNCKDDLIKNI